MVCIASLRNRCFNMNFNTLPVAERQLQVNSVLVPAVKRLPLRIRRNASVMGQTVKFVWDGLKNGHKLTQAAVRKAARGAASRLRPPSCNRGLCSQPGNRATPP